MNYVRRFLHRIHGRLGHRNLRVGYQADRPDLRQDLGQTEKVRGGEQMDQMIHNEIADMRYRLDKLESKVLEAQVNNTAPEMSDEVQEAAHALAMAIAKSQGVDVEAMGGMGMAAGAQLPVLKLPQEFMKFGGIGIGVIMAEPQQVEAEEEAF